MDRPTNNNSLQGTVFYKITPLEFEDAFDSAEVNAFLQYLALSRGFNAFDLDKMYGSFEYGDDFYLCVTDEYPIIIDGEEVQPEYAYEDYGFDAIANLVQPSTPEIILKYFTTYELEDFDIDEVADRMMNREGYTFSMLVNEANDPDFNLLDKIID